MIQNTAAADSYLSLADGAEALLVEMLDRLRSARAAAASGEPVHWGHVGALASVADTLPGSLRILSELH